MGHDSDSGFNISAGSRPVCCAEMAAVKSKATRQAIARTFLIIEFYAALMAVYFIINFTISRVGAAMERRMTYVRF